ncbi:type III-B CRISPR module-associated protein Cmr3 [Fontivita pretiosa]|uniref:type III-B CRISPR module-associated protein Cmr3 n=1 Tax=Fontivita pretiosa TaxID=2989684 RepID=UPI003D17BC2C
MKTMGFCMQPLDVLFFRDGRPFTGSERSVSGLPLPQTFAGAIRTALLRAAGCDFGRLKQELERGKSFDQAVQAACTQEHHWIGQLAVRGPWLARRNNATDNLEVLVPVPANLHQEKYKHTGPLRRLTPLPREQLPGWNPPQDQQDLRPLWLKHLSSTEPAAGYLTPQGLARFLGDESVLSEDLVAADELFGLDYRTGIGIAPDRLVAEESQIFGRGFLALEKDVYLYAEIEMPSDAPDGLFDQVKTLTLGGEARHVTLKRLPSPFTWPNKSPNAKQKPLILLATPCPFEAGWKPRILDGQLVAAAVPGSLAFSGWDLARGGPKPTRFAVPAGSVYFLKSLPNNWQPGLAESDEDRRQGWGYCLTGVWTDE